ncbi:MULTISPECIES: hypothetical protein [Streptomyces]|uniref:hypothetical protein n=1 Tax=Streptomyces TaxID=1883 RepID=UPI0005173F08|nr:MULTISPECIES: hypothetical protein [Streptomyces]MDX2982230.1 hypothetical protein [Streptomyces sp. NRRL_B-2249]WSS38737.1 hypothetical protein OG269_37125 [Streptomyces microflavus]WST12545.1 hypothetical protein OG721_00520 [Streptomyces microflavus]
MALAALALALAVAATVIVVRVTGSSPDDDRVAAAGPTASKRQTPIGAVYAYTTEREFVLVRGESPPVRVSRVFDLSDSAKNDVVWTHDGRWVTLLSDAALLDQPDSVQLITLNAQTGEVRRRPCPNCDDLAPVGDHDVIALRWDNDARETRAVRYDAGDPADHGTQIPPASDSDGTWQNLLLGGTRTHLLTGEYVMSGGEPGMELRLHELKGTAGTGITASYTRFDSNAYMPTALATIDGRERIAVGVRQNPGECATSFPIVLLDLNGEVHGTDQSAAMPPGYIPAVTGGIEVHDLWWGPDQHLYATISSWTCDNSADSEDVKRRVHRPSTLWRLDGERWAAAGTQPATVARQLDRSTTMILTIPDCIGPTDRADAGTYCNSGTLSREHDGKRTKIADGVLGLSAPPSDR